MATIEDYYKLAEDELVALLRDNINDPLNKRPTGQFIDHAEGHYEARTPFILVKRARDNTRPFTGIGEKKQDLLPTFSIYIEVASTQKGLVKGERYGGPELLNVLTGAVAKIMEDNTLPYTNNSSSVMKQITRITVGDYKRNPETRNHYNIQLYNVEVLNN